MNFKSTSAVSFTAAFLITIFAIGYSNPSYVGAQGESKAPKVRESFAAKVNKPVRQSTAIEIEADEEFPAYTNAELLVKTDAKFLKVKVQKTLFDVVKAYEVVHGVQNERKYVFTGSPGKYAVTVTTFDPDGGIGEESTTIVLGDPEPVPPTPPGPTPPGPTPPGPTPPNPDVITPSPIRLLFIEETDARDKLTPVQYSILFGSDSNSVRQFLKEKAAKNSQGHPEWRLLDDDLTDEHLKYEGENFQEIYKKKTWKSTPWFILSNEKGNGIEGPLDFKSVEEFKALLQKYSG